jgi:hypothetical protein
MKKKTYLERMGLKPVEKLNKKICMERVSFLRKAIKANRFEGKLLKQAKYYAGWYKWMAENGGSRSNKKSA